MLDKIFEIAKAKGYSTYALAEAMQVSIQTISYWKHGIKYPRHDKLIDLIEILGLEVTFNELKEEEEDARST